MLQKVRTTYGLRQSTSVYNQYELIHILNDGTRRTWSFDTKREVNEQINEILRGAYE
jgi:hypothetical protein